MRRNSSVTASEQLVVCLRYGSVTEPITYGSHSCVNVFLQDVVCLQSRQCSHCDEILNAEAAKHLPDLNYSL